MIHLDVRTDFSFLKSYGLPEQVFNRVKEIGANAVGIADLASTWGHIPFWKAGKKAGIKVILGCALPVVPELDKDPRHDIVVLLAKDSEGLREQYRALSLATQQFFHRPRLTWSQVAAVPGNIKIVTRLGAGNEKHLKASALQDNFFLGVSATPSNIMRLARQGDFPCCVAMGPLFPAPEDREAYQLMRAIGSARKTGEVESPDAWIMRDREIIQKLSQFTEATILDWMANNAIIADCCDANLPQAQNVKPGLDITLEEWCAKGAKARGINLGEEPYKSRLEMELKLIYQKGFQDYFLLIADLVAWAKERMFVGPARGSSAGSLVCYLMGIVEVDPITHKLMFERFIDVTRNDLPDVDIDFPDERRDEVFKYIADTYGSDRVARIGTVAVFKARSSIADVAKSYSIPKWEIEPLADVLIERSSGDARANMTVMDTMAQFDIAKELVSKYPKLHMAGKIEGHARHTGKHAAGICISNDDIHKYVSIDHYKDGIAELTKYDAEAIGLMKIDALGLRTLSVIQDCCDQVGLDPRQLYTLPLDDMRAIELFRQDKVAGIFQFEGYALRSLMKTMGVNSFNDVVALTSLARPGPLHSGGALEYVARYKGAKDWDYIHPSLASHTGHTYGVIVYQEQVMSITRDLGGMDWQDVNALRRAMSKSLGEEFFNRYRDKFLVGTRQRGIPDETAISIWDDMCTFGSWAFNLSHAVSYGLISYWCAYLKALYPLQFAVAHLRRAASDDHVFRLLRELKKEGIEVIYFDPQHSDVNWSVKDGKVYGGYLGVRGVGPLSAPKLLAARDNDPEGWLNKLSLAQRAKLLAPNNTPWHNLTRLHRDYAHLYRDPDGHNIAGPIVDIEAIDEKMPQGTEYCFIATLKQRNLRDLNETMNVAKRGGKIIEHDNLFLNLKFEDDTQSIICTIGRFDYARIGKQLMEEESDEKDFLIRGHLARVNWRKIQITKLKRLN